MYCPECGTANDDQASFCYKCGTNLKTGEQEVGQVAQGIRLAATYVGFWKRLAAYLIDYFVIAAVYGIFFSLVILFDSLSNLFLSNSMIEPFFISVYIIAVIGVWLYFSLMESSSKQATLGKMALGIIVTDMTGNRISFGRATGRYFGKILSQFIFYIGHIMIAFTEKKQGLHDMLANTLVVNKQ